MKRMLKMAASLLFSLLFCFSACTVSGGSGNGTGNGAGTGTEQPGGDEGTETPENPDTPDNPEQPDNPDNPDNPETPDEPTEPTEPVYPEPEEETPEATPKAVSGVELIQTLKSSPYRSAISNTEYGLTEANAVGADVRAFSRTLYPAPIAGVKTYEVADYGISPSGTSNTRDFNALLKELKGVTGVKKVVFGAGKYTFDGTIEMNGIEDLYIVGENTDFVYSTWCSAYKIKDCKNIHFNGVSVDYDPSPVVAGSVKSCDKAAGTITIQLNDEFSLKDERYNGGIINYGSYMEFCTDENGMYYPNPNGNLLYNSTGDNVKNITGGTYNPSSNELTLTFTSIKSVAAGTKVSVAFTMYEYPAITVNECENFYMEDCNIYCSAGMSLHLASVKNTYLNRMNIRLRADSARLMTATADGIHAKDCVGDLFVTGSVLENSHDDSMNVASFYKEVTGNYMREITCSATSTTNYPVEAGDVIEIYNPATFELYGTYTVKEVYKSLLTYTLTVDKLIRDDITGMIVGNVTRSPKLKVNDCVFQNKRNRGILLQTRNSDISGNTFRNIVHGPISIHSVLDIFAEAIVPKDVTVSNNKFINNNQGYGLSGDVAVFARGNDGSGATGAIKNITVKNNFFYGSARTGIFFSAAGNGAVENNLLCKTGTVDNAQYAIYIGISENMTVSGNCAVRAQSGSEFAVLAKAEATVTESSNTIKIHGGI